MFLSMSLKISRSNVLLCCDVLKHFPRTAVLFALSSEYFFKVELDCCLLHNLYPVCPGRPPRDTIYEAHIPQIKNEKDYTKNIKYSQIQQFIFQPAWRNTKPSVFGRGGECVSVKLIDFFLLHSRLWGYSLNLLFCTFGAQHPLQWLTAGAPLHADKELLLATRKKKEHYQANYHMTWWVISADVAATLRRNLEETFWPSCYSFWHSTGLKNCNDSSDMRDKQLPENICRNSYRLLYLWVYLKTMSADWKVIITLQYRAHTHRPMNERLRSPGSCTAE